MGVNMLITVVVGILMTYVGYIFGRASGRKQGIAMMGTLIVKSIQHDPEKAIEVIREKFSAKN
jgi:hypothetical protein